MATYGELYGHIELDVFRSTPTIYLPSVKNAILAAIRFFEHKPAWFTEVVGSDLSLTSGTNNVALPANFAASNNFRILVNGYYRGRGTGFDPIPFEELRKKYTSPTQTGTPMEYALFAGKLYTGVLADATYAIANDYYKKDTTAPSASGDTSIWFAEGYDVIRYEAMSILYGDRLKDKENEAKYHAKALGWYDNLRERDHNREYIHRLA